MAAALGFFFGRCNGFFFAAMEHIQLDTVVCGIMMAACVTTNAALLACTFSPETIIFAIMDRFFTFATSAINMAGVLYVASSIVLLFKREEKHTMDSLIKNVKGISMETTILMKPDQTKTETSTPTPSPTSVETSPPTPSSNKSVGDCIKPDDEISSDTASGASTAE